MKSTATITEQPCKTHKSKKLPYIAHNEWALRKLKKGEKQRQCSTCGRFYFDEEF